MGLAAEPGFHFVEEGFPVARSIGMFRKRNAKVFGRKGVLLNIKNSAEISLYRNGCVEEFFFYLVRLISIPEASEKVFNTVLMVRASCAVGAPMSMVSSTNC